MDWDGLGSIGMYWDGFRVRDCEGLGGIGMDWDEVRWIGVDWDRLGLKWIEMD